MGFEAELAAARGGEPRPDDETRARRGRTSRRAGRAGGPRDRQGRAHPASATKGGVRSSSSFAASWAELQRVQWPDRRQVGQATAVVLGFVVIAGAYLGLLDAIAQRVIDFIL